MFLIFVCLSPEPSKFNVSNIKSDPIFYVVENQKSKKNGNMCLTD